jgi:methenyltetrahydromethanopterin cyclohydrolase
MTLNERASQIALAAIENRSALQIAIHQVAGVRVIDCGVEAAGCLDAGLMMARAALAGLGEVWIEPVGNHGDRFASLWPGCPWPVVAVGSREPVSACLASQYAGWKVATKNYFAMTSGPIRAVIGREDLFDSIEGRETSGVAVGLLEASRLPPADVCLSLAENAGVPPEGLILLVARTASAAGTVQVIARSLETALHKLHDLGFDLRRIRAGLGRAPLAPVPADDLTAIGRTNDAILYGGQVELEVCGDDASLAEIGPRMVSGASADYGSSFLQLFERAGRDFYAIDPALFAPASVELVNVDTGMRHRFGALAPDLVTASFIPAGAANATIAR